MTLKSLPADSEIKEMYGKDRREGFKLLYLKYSDRIFAVCKRYSADNQEALDYFQEAMVKIDFKMGSYQYRGEGSLLSWMKRVTVNMMIESLRRKRSEVVLAGDLSEEVPNISYDEAMNIPIEEMFRMIERLSPLKRAVFNLFCVEEYSHKEIAKMLGISEKGSSSLLSKARRELSQMVKDYLKNL